MQWYKRYLGDWKRDTGHLSLLEKGAYSELLDHYYATEDGLPVEMGRLYRIAGAVNQEEQAAVRRVASEFFVVNGRGVRENKRAEVEIEKAQSKSEANRRAALKRWDSGG